MQRTSMVQKKFISLNTGSTPVSSMMRCCAGSPCKQCRQDLEAAGFSTELTSGCKIFVRPAHYNSVLNALQGRTLKPYHVVVAESFEHLVCESLITLPCKQRPRAKHRHALRIDEGSLESQT